MFIKVLRDNYEITDTTGPENWILSVLCGPQRTLKNIFTLNSGAPHYFVLAHITNPVWRSLPSSTGRDIGKYRIFTGDISVIPAKLLY